MTKIILFIPVIVCITILIWAMYNANKKLLLYFIIAVLFGIGFYFKSDSPNNECLYNDCTMPVGLYQDDYNISIDSYNQNYITFSDGPLPTGTSISIIFSDYAHVKSMDSIYNIAVKNHYKSATKGILYLMQNDSTYQKVINHRNKNYTDTLHSEIPNPIKH